MNCPHLFPLKACRRVLTGANTARVFMSSREAVLSRIPQRRRRHLPPPPFAATPESSDVSTSAKLPLCSPNLLGCWCGIIYCRTVIGYFCSIGAQGEYISGSCACVVHQRTENT